MAYQKRNMWIGVKDGVCKKLSLEKDALAFEGQEQATVIVEEPVHEEEEVHTYNEEKEEDSFEQEAVLEGEDSSEEKI